MIPYQNGNSKVILGYEIGEDYIIVYFKDGYCYKYSYSSCGMRSVSKMMVLAEEQEGLTTYIGSYGNELDYEWKRRY